MQQLAGMRQSASSLQKRVARLSGDVHPRMLAQVQLDPFITSRYLQLPPVCVYVSMYV